METTKSVQPYWLNWLLPSVAAILFFGQLSLAWPKGEALLEDPGTGWHLRTGRLMLETGHLVETDPYSFTAAGAPWVTFEWGSQILLALAERAGGLAGVVILTSLLFAVLPCLLLRVVVRAGVSYGAAFLYTLLALVVFQAHALARPHAFSYLLFAGIMWILGDRVRALAWRQWLGLGLLFALWANLHGGFAAGLVYLFCRLAASIADAGPGEKMGVLRKNFSAGVFCFLCTLLNPHGIGLHEKVIHTVLGLKTLSFWQEFQPPDFYGADVLAVVVWVIAGTLLVGGLRGRLAVVPWETVLPIGIFLVLACKSQRHVFLLLLVAAPLVARIWQIALADFLGNRGERWRMFFERQSVLKSDAILLPLMGLAFVFLYFNSSALNGLILGRSRLSVPAREWIRHHTALLQRPVTTTANGGVLIYEFWPAFRVGFDDRSDFYGDALNLKMLRLIEGRRGWTNVLDQYAFTSAILSTEDALNAGLEKTLDWKRVYADDVTTIWLLGSKPE